MARKTTVALEDDLEGGPASETVRFSLSGTEYEIDLNAANACTFCQQLALFAGHTRKAGTGPRRQAARTALSRERGGNIRARARA